MDSDGAGPTWQPLKRTRAHELVIEAIEEQIVAGALTVGDALPPERELAARLQVSRAGVREAVRVLESDGILRSRPGAGAESGTFVAALPRDALTRVLRLHVALANFEMAQVIDARVVLERHSAAAAAQHAAADALDVARQALARMDADGVSQEAFNDADTDFHIAIAEAGGNALLASLTAAIRDSLRRPILDAIRRTEGWDAVSDSLRAEHRGLLQAIEDGDAELAADRAEQHIRHSTVQLPATYAPA